MRKHITATLLALLVTLGVVGLANATGVDSEPTTREHVIRGGVIRIGSGTNLYVHQNSAHAAQGITAIRLVNSCDLQLDTDRQPDERIMAAIAEEDETISRLGVQAGISGGLEQVNIYLYKDGKKICANDPMFGTLSNLWVELTYVRVPAA